jgi:hypothetical protein
VIDVRPSNNPWDRPYFLFFLDVLLKKSWKMMAFGSLYLFGAISAVCWLMRCVVPSGDDMGVRWLRLTKETDRGDDEGGQSLVPIPALRWWPEANTPSLAIETVGFVDQQGGRTSFWPLSAVLTVFGIHLVVEG